MADKPALGIAEAIRQSSAPMASAFQAIAAVYSDRALTDLQIQYRRDCVEVKFPIGLRMDIINTLTRKFADAGWGFSIDCTTQGTVRSVVLLMPDSLTQIRRASRPAVSSIRPGKSANAGDVQRQLNEARRRTIEPTEESRSSGIRRDPSADAQSATWEEPESR